MMHPQKGNESRIYNILTKKGRKKKLKQMVKNKSKKKKRGMGMGISLADKNHTFFFLGLFIVATTSLLPAIYTHTPKVMTQTLSQLKIQSL